MVYYLHKERKKGRQSMGKFVNPDNSAFQVALNSEIYVDKTGLIEYTNRVLGSPQAYICNSRPRRFGKSITANMLAAYYSRGCDSKEMFDNFAISQGNNYKKHINKYDVIHFDVQWVISQAESTDSCVSFIEKIIVDELRDEYPGCLPGGTIRLSTALSSIFSITGRKFIIIIDEWDVLIRDAASNTGIQDEYIDFLRSLFKGIEPTKYILLAYMTGILPIKKVKTQSALNNFIEFSMLDAKVFAPYIGFTEEEVRLLCKKHNRNFEQVKQWYDGYLLEGIHVYNPTSVVNVMLWGKYNSYWYATSSYESIKTFVNQDFDGLKQDIITMLSGNQVKVKPMSFQNDMVNFKNKDDILTVLIHLGYLAFNGDYSTAYIPNEEICKEFSDALEENKWTELSALLSESEKLLQATLRLDGNAVSNGIEKIHDLFISSIQYNNENSLSCVLTIAYLFSLNYYFKPVREFPLGKGFADIVYIPRPDYAMEYPALVIELKWNQSAETAIMQIRQKNYPDPIKCYAGKILMVGINYDKDTKHHQCIIEEYMK